MSNLKPDEASRLKAVAEHKARLQDAVRAVNSDATSSLRARAQIKALMAEKVFEQMGYVPVKGCA